MRFTDPLYLLLLIPVAYGLFWTYRRTGGMMKGRKRLAFGIRFVLASLLILALAGPQLYRPNVGTCTVFVLDRSDSIRDVDRRKQETFVKEALKSLNDDDVAAVVVFGKNSNIDIAPSKLSGLPKLTAIADPSASDLAAAIRLASATFPDGKAKRIVVLSDGNETNGDAADAATVAAADGIQIDHVALGSVQEDAEVAVLSTEVPNETRVDQPFDVRVVATATKATRGELVLDRDGQIVARQPVQLNPGSNTFVIAQRLERPGFARYRATIQAEADRDNRNNVGAGFVSIKGKPKVLILQQKPEITALARALNEQGIDTDLRGPGGMPARPESFQAYDAVIFNDINAATMTPTQMKMMQSAIRDSGIGFAMIGGENSFLPGGWYGTPIAEALPVDLNIRQRKNFPSTTILVVADTSGSMGMIEDGVPKVKLAAKAAEQTVLLLSPMDRVGVAGSTDAIEFCAPIQKLTDKQAVINQIRKLDVGGGGIYIKPSLEFARKHLNNENTQVRHLILLADGQDCDLIDGCIPYVTAMRGEKITTSVVSIGDGQFVPFLKQLAAAGGGRFYLATKASQLPAIFTQDAAVMSRSAIEEGAFFPKVMMGEEVTRGIDPGAFPALLAYCLADSRPIARTGMRTGKDDPLLASWQYGLGTSLAFTSDAQPRWAQRWTTWSGFSTFWAQAVRSISRRATSNQYQIEAIQEGTKGKITMRATDPNGNPMNNLPAKVRVASPSGNAQELTLSQVAPGEYVGTFEASEIGSYIVTVAENDAQGVRVNASGFSVPYPPEYRYSRPNLPLLSGLSTVTEGKELKTPAEALRPVESPGSSLTELWALCVLLAALLLPLDIAARRIALPVGEILAKALAWIRAKSLKARAPTETEAAIGRLQSAKQRVAKRSDAPSATVSSSDSSSSASSPAAKADEKPAPRPAASVGGSAAGSKLLEKKRKRDSGEE
ncbi:MAG: VWA domain-containing protein [Fimbriimonadaceae bacterium]|nr:VWA domain-containing protein [Fimbriimonadaceae bacterium]